LTVVVWIGVIVLAGVAVVVLALKAPAAGIPLPSGAPRRRARAIEQRGFRAALVLLLLLPLLPLVTRPGTGGTPATGGVGPPPLRASKAAQEAVGLPSETAATAKTASKLNFTNAPFRSP